jgi:hypothetical protein
MELRMRAREFLSEQLTALDPGQSEPLQHTYILPGIRNNDAYHAMRLGVAIARARSNAGPGQPPGMSPFPEQSAFGQNAIVSGFSDNVEEILDQALKMTNTPGGKRLIGSKTSEEPAQVNQRSPVRPFRGYRR